MFTILEADSDIAERYTEIDLKAAVALIVGMDAAAGRVHYDLARTQIVQVPSTPTGADSFFIHGVPSRAARPQRPATCPLCLATVRSVGQHFIRFQLPQWQAVLLANPYAYLPECTTWGTADHLPQRCGTSEGTTNWEHVFAMMVLLCTELEGHVVGFNETAGNSLDHLHLVSHRPPRDLVPYPAQRAAERCGDHSEICHLGPGRGYPTDVFRIRTTSAADTAERAADLVRAWQQCGGEFASANCAAILEDGQPVLYVFPRTRLLAPWGWQAAPAFLEMLGVFIATRDFEIARVRRGHWGFDHFANVLASLRPLGVERALSGGYRRQAR